MNEWHIINQPNIQRLQNQLSFLEMHGYTNKPSTSNSNVRYELKKENKGQYRNKGNYRKEGRFEDEEREEKIESGYHKRVYHKNEPVGVNTTKQCENTTNKISIAKKPSQQPLNYFISFKNRQIQLGSSWKQILQSIDRHFPQSDMILNLAVKINVWDQLRTGLVIPNQDVEEILILYGKYRGC